MSLGTNKLKVALDVDGERKYLKNISIVGSEISYDLDEVGDILDNTPETGNNLAMLRSNEPDKEFIVVGVE